MTESKEKSDQVFSVLNWNILADNFMSFESFQHVDKEFLKYSHRRNLKDIITKANPTILCLQEVDYNNNFFQFLTQNGYEYRYRPKGMQGIVIAYKSQTFKLVKEKMLNFDDLLTTKQNKHVYTKGHGILLLKLQGLGRQIVVATTHLFWDPQFEKIKYHQICSSIQTIKQFSGTKPIPIIFCADLNSIPTSNVLNLIINNEAPQQQNIVNPQFNFDDMKERYSQLHKKGVNSIPFKSVFNQSDGEATNFSSTMKLFIDYIFYIGLQLVRKQKLIEFNDTNIPPNSEFPSDHIPLICQFK